ncbi:hypothetical protein ACSHWB_21805 [Lentzea sp. HUAS TT2]|uniref:hypothetical protein n=1 Tax=Lentzea sp. HUAS TT2 TaxID=3447454 RepID=UPI003F708F53
MTSTLVKVHPAPDVMPALEDAEQLLSRSLAEQARRRLSVYGAVDVSGDPSTAARWLHAMGVALRDTGNSDKALHYFGQLRDLAIATGATGMSEWATMNMIVSLMNAGRWRIADTLLARSRSAVRVLDDPSFRVETLFWTARVLEARGASRAALDLARRRLLPASTAVEHRDLRIARHAFVARLALNQRTIDWDQAHRALAEAWRLLEPETCALRTGQVLVAQALYDLRRGARDEAERWLDEAQAVFAVGGLVTPHATSLNNELRLISG